MTDDDQQERTVEVELEMDVVARSDKKAQLIAYRVLNEFLQDQYPYWIKRVGDREFPVMQRSSARQPL